MKHRQPHVSGTNIQYVVVEELSNKKYRYTAILEDGEREVLREKSNKLFDYVYFYRSVASASKKGLARYCTFGRTPLHAIRSKLVGQYQISLPKHHPELFPAQTNRIAGRPRINPQMRKVKNTIRFESWLTDWLNEHDEDKAELVRSAVMNYYGLTPPVLLFKDNEVS